MGGVNEDTDMRLGREGKGRLEEEGKLKNKVWMKGFG